MPANRTKTKTSLAAVIVRIRTIANDHYHGKIYDNILAIFNQLSTVEKRVLLRGLVGICFIVENKILSEVETVKETKHRIQAEKPEDDDEDSVVKELEVVNQKELISMKSWAFRWIFSALVIILVAAMVGSWIATGKVELFDKLKDVAELFKVLFGE